MTQPSLATILAMSTTLPLSEVKNRFSELADQIEREHDRVLVTKNGRPSVVVLSMDELESLEATVEVLSDDAMMAQVRESQADIAAGRVTSMTKEQLLAEIRERRAVS